ncbi:hypothetical protein SDC9_52019 [bioreactor metagenome]|uniref:Uncharacterized protein n=1 Tax=bioreactor metagenome TaxID=1076179 RepID=A0A644WQI8_9ZZZZ
MHTEFEVVHRKQIVVVHDMSKVSSAFFTHFALAVVKLAHFLVETAAAFHNGIKISHIVDVSTNARNFCNNCPDFFVAENSTDSTASGLFQTNFLTFAVIEGEVEHSDERMISSISGRNNTDVLFFLVFVGKKIGQFFGKHM